MTLTTTTGSPRVSQIMFTSGDESVDALAGSLDQSAIVKTLAAAFAGLGKAGRKVVAHEVGAVAARLLDPNLSDVLLAAWRKHVALKEAGRRTFEAPGAREVVELLTHRITSTHRPSVDLMIDGVRVATINFELALSFFVEGMTAAVGYGELVEVHSGRCEVSATLSAEGVEIARGDGRFELGLGVRLEHPLRLWPATPQDDLEMELN